MSLSIAANLILGILEFFVLSGCIWYFMAENGRTVFRKRGWYFGGFLLYMAAFFLVNSGADIWKFPLDILLTLLAGAVLFCPKPGALLLDALLVLCLGLAETFWIWVANMVMTCGRWDPYLIADVLIAVKIMTMLAMTRCFLFLRKREKIQKLQPRQMAAVGILPVASIFFLFSLIEVGSIYIQLYGMWLILVNIAVLLLLNVLFFYLMYDLFRASRMEQEMELFKTQSELQCRYYTELEKKYQESRKLIHDMKNHLQSVENLYREQEPEAGERYVQDICHMLNALGEKHYSPDKMLNIILNDKLDKARRLGIEVRAEVGDADFSDMRDLDITAVFANLLDNAIEAAGETTPAFLEIRISEVQEFRVVSIRNSRKKGTGRKSGHMGLGLANVRRSLEAYCGTMQVEENEDEYRVNLMLPKG